MRPTVIALVVLLTSAHRVAAQSQSEPTSHERAVAELVDLLQLQQVVESSIETMTATMVSQNPALAQLEDVFVDFFREYMGWEDLREGYIRIYREAYSESEIGELIAFYRTPVGQKTVEITPELIRQGNDLGQRMIEPHLPELQRRIQARLGGGAPDPGW